MSYPGLENSSWAQDWNGQAEQLAGFLRNVAKKGDESSYISITGNEPLVTSERSLASSVEKVESFVQLFIQERPQGVSSATLKNLSNALGEFHQKVDGKLSLLGRIKYAFVRNVGTHALEKAIKEEERISQQGNSGVPIFEESKIAEDSKSDSVSELSDDESIFSPVGDWELLWRRAVKDLTAELLGVAEKENYYIRISRDIKTNRIMISGGGNPALASSVQEVESLILDLITHKPEGVLEEDLQGLSNALKGFHEKVDKKLGLLGRIQYVFVRNVGAHALEKAIKEQKTKERTSFGYDKALERNSAHDYFRGSNDWENTSDGSEGLLEADWGEDVEEDIQGLEWDNASETSDSSSDVGLQQRGSVEAPTESSFGMRRRVSSGGNSKVGAESSSGGFWQTVSDKFFGRKKQLKAEPSKLDSLSFSTISTGSLTSAAEEEVRPYGYQEYQNLLVLLEQDDFKDNIDGCIEMAENMEPSCIKGEMLLAIEKRLEQLQIGNPKDALRLSALIAVNEQTLDPEEVPFQLLLNNCLDLVEQGKGKEAIDVLKSSTLPSSIVKDARLRLICQELVSKGKFDLAIQAVQAMTTPKVRSRAILDICDGAMRVFKDVSLERFSALLESIPKEEALTCQERYRKTWDRLDSLLEVTYHAAYREVSAMVDMAESDNDFATCIESAKLLNERQEEIFIRIFEKLMVYEKWEKALEVTDLLSDKRQAKGLRFRVLDEFTSACREIVRQGDFEGAIAKAQTVLRAWSPNYQERVDIALGIAIALIMQQDERREGLEISQISEVIDGLFALDVEEGCIKDVKHCGIGLIAEELCKLGKFSLALTAAQNLPKGAARNWLERQIQESLAEFVARLPKLEPNVVSPPSQMEKQVSPDLSLQEDASGALEIFERGPILDIESRLRALDEGSPELDALAAENKKLSFDEKKQAAFASADKFLEKGDVWAALEMLNLRDRDGKPLVPSQMQEVSDKLGQMCDLLIEEKRFDEVCQIAEELHGLSFSKEWQNNFILSICDRLIKAGDQGLILGQVIHFASIPESEKRQWMDRVILGQSKKESQGDAVSDDFTSPEASDRDASIDEDLGGGIFHRVTSSNELGDIPSALSEDEEIERHNTEFLAEVDRRRNVEKEVGRKMCTDVLQTILGAQSGSSGLSLDEFNEIRGRAAEITITKDRVLPWIPVERRVLFNTTVNPFLPSEVTFHLPDNLPVKLTTFADGYRVMSELEFGRLEGSADFIFDLAPNFTVDYTIPWIFRSKLPATIPTRITGVCLSEIILDPNSPDGIVVGVRLRDGENNLTKEERVPLYMEGFQELWKEIWSPPKKAAPSRGPFGLW